MRSQRRGGSGLVITNQSLSNSSFTSNNTCMQKYDEMVSNTHF